MMVCRHIPPAPGCQRGPEPWPRRPGELVPFLAAIDGSEKGSVLDAGVDRVGVGQGRLEMPDPVEFPGVRRPVVPLVGPGTPS